MKIEDIFNKPVDVPIYPFLDEFVVTKGIDKVTTKDLNKFVAHYGERAIGINGFDTLYSIVSSNNSGKIMSRWTIAIGIMTLIMTFCTVGMFLKDS